MIGYRLALNAFKCVMGKRQSKFRAVIKWLDTEIRALRTKEAECCARMERIVGS